MVLLVGLRHTVDAKKRRMNATGTLERRTTIATMMLKLNVNAKIIQARLGHSSYQVTMDIYAHLMSDSQIGAIEAFEDHLNSSKM